MQADEPVTHPAIEKAREALKNALISLRAWNGDATWELYRRSPEVEGIEAALRALDEAMNHAETLELVTASHRGVRRFLCLPFPEEGAK